MTNIQSFILATLTIITGLCPKETLAQPEFTTWGNMTGIRMDGQLMNFETSIFIANTDWSKTRRTARERQRIRFERENDKKIFSYVMDSLDVIKSIEEIEQGTARVTVEYTSRADTSLAGAFFRFDLPEDYYLNGNIDIEGKAPIPIKPQNTDKENIYFKGAVKNIKFQSPKRQIILSLDKNTDITIKDDPKEDDGNLQVYLTILPGAMTIGQTAKRVITIKASGEIDRDPVKLTLDTSSHGQPFDGIGGNFRLQNAETDPQVIDYSLKNLRVSWARVEMPWRFWHPEEDKDPVKEADAGNLHPRVKAAMEMAQRIYKMGIPVVLADWSGPDWAITGKMSFGPQPGGLRGNPLNPEKAEKIYESITAYVLYLKEHYGVEIKSFSFNESDLGIYIRQTSDEHAQLIKGLGAYMAAKGLNTRLLLGDTADVNGWPFAKEAAEDKGTHPYIGAVSFHSWRGYSDDNLLKWAEIARNLKKPLIVGEGSIDAGAWRYPRIFEEPTYAIDEIDLYIKILKLCEPLSILQWQLTADYSAMSGGGVFGNTEEPLHPTQRFWNLKQLGSTPKGSFAMPIYTDKGDVTCSALGDNTKKAYTIHMVNRGSTRSTTLTGIPDGVKAFDVYFTDVNHNMQQLNKVMVNDGKVEFRLNAAGFTTLMSTN